MLYLIVIEPIETRYTCEWYEFIPKLLEENGIRVHIIEGSDRQYRTSEGAFLDFSATNIYKSEQVIQIAELFAGNHIKDGDQFLFLDAWHPGIINLKYMAELNRVDVKIFGVWHAGSYDPHDFLGYTIKDKTWTSHAEKAYFFACDYNFFATKFHIGMFCRNLSVSTYDRIVRTGFPFDYLETLFSEYRNTKKENIILFPHRKAQEKQLNIFLNLKEQLPQYEFVVCADQNLSKVEYRDLIGKSKLVFSANLQETLGISCYEILAAGGMILVPHRLSYIEMYAGEVVYPSFWTADYDGYICCREKLVNKIIDVMENFESSKIQDAIKQNFAKTRDEYFTAKRMIEVIKNA